MQDDRLSTPARSCGCRTGVIREWVITRRKVEERRLQREDVLNADEIFLTNSWIGVMPVATLEGRPLGPRSVGPKLAAEFCRTPRGLLNEGSGAAKERRARNSSAARELCKQASRLLPAAWRLARACHRRRHHRVHPRRPPGRGGRPGLEFFKRQFPVAVLVHSFERGVGALRIALPRRSRLELLEADRAVVVAVEFLERFLGIRPSAATATSGPPGPPGGGPGGLSWPMESVPAKASALNVVINVFIRFV